MKLDLSNVTAICIDGRPVDPARQANYQTILKYMLSCVTFGKIKMISLEDPIVDGVEFIQTEPLTIQEYSQFCINKLHSYVDTEFCLVFQDDGFILNPEKWDDNFLCFDFVGAPFPLYYGEPNDIGNGGFCLRSKAFMDKASEIIGDSYCDHAEDVFLCCTIYNQMLNFGFKYADIDTACKFSVEQEWSKTNHQSFGKIKTELRIF